MNWMQLLGADGVTVVGILIASALLVGFQYIRLQGRYLARLESEIEAQHAALLRRDEDDRELLKEWAERLSQIIYMLQQSEKQKDQILHAIDRNWQSIQTRRGEGRGDKK